MIGFVKTLPAFDPPESVTLTLEFMTVIEPETVLPFSMSAPPSCELLGPIGKAVSATLPLTNPGFSSPSVRLGARTLYAQTFLRSRTPTGVGVGLEVGVGDGFGVGEAVGIGVGVAVGTGLGVAVGNGAGVFAGPGVGVALAAGVGVGAGVELGFTVGLGVAVAAGVGVGRPITPVCVLRPPPSADEPGMV